MPQTAPYPGIGIVGGKHHTDHAKFGDGPAQFLDRFAHILHRQNGHAAQALAGAIEAVTEPVVIGACQRHRPVSILNHHE